MNDRKKRYKPSQETERFPLLLSIDENGKRESNATQEVEQAHHSVAHNEPTPPPSFRELYESSPHLNSVIVPFGAILGYSPHSDVYLGELAGSGQSVTIKVDRRPMRSTKKTPSQFQNVQRKVAQLKRFKHPGIAEFIDWIPDWENNHSYIIMRHIEGRGLNQALADGQTFSQAQVLDWTFQLLDAMEYLHNQRCVIGDLDASNVVLTPDNKRVCLVDFKYLSAIEYGQHSKDKTENQSFGLYEETEGEALAQGIREDIRRLGRLMFELLTHEKLDDKPQEETFSDATRKMLRQKLSVKSVSDSVADVILRAMSPEPGEVFQSVSDMRLVLQELPAKDKQASFQMFALASGVLLTIAMLAIGAFFIWKGQYQSYRYFEMALEAKSAEETWRNGDYDAALYHALSATLSKDSIDPPCPPEAQSALARIISSYDYISGYKPYRSDYPLLGRPVQARFSPDGACIAVLVEDANAYPSAKRIQFFDAESAEEVCAPLTVSYSERSEFVFLNNDALFYAGENAVKVYSLSRQQDIWTGPPGSSDSRYAVSIAVSADGTKAASVLWGGALAYLYDVDAILNGEPTKQSPRSFPLVRPNEMTQSDDFPFVFLASMTKNLLALNQDGCYMAVSFADGGAGIYDLNAPTPEEGYRELLDSSSYLYFEGGFYRQDSDSGTYEDWFFYVASTTGQTSDMIPVTSEGNLIRLSDMERILSMQSYAPIHIQADRGGIFLSVGDWLYHANTDAPGAVFWEYLAQAEGTIRLLRHVAGRILAVTENQSVLTYREDGAWVRRIADGAFNIADLAGEYALLASRNKTTLSVLRWREQGETLLYYNANDETDEMTYYAHLGAHISVDGETAMLYRSTGFRVYDLVTGTRVDKAWDEDETPFGREAERVTYQRAPVFSDDPHQECLKVLYKDEVEFYSANGEKLPTFSRMRRPEDDNAVFQTNSYLVKQDSGSGSVEIYSAMRPNRLLKQWQEDNLTYASQQGTYLILSLMTDWQEMYSLLLDENLDVVAKIPQPCEAFPYGNSLIFDDMQGRLLQGPLYTLEDLRMLAVNWEKTG